MAERGDPVPVLGPREALDLIADGSAPGVGAPEVGAVMVVELRRGEALGTLGRYARDLPRVLVGVAVDDDLEAPEGFDVVVTPVAGAPAPWVSSDDPAADATELAACARRSPQAAVALVQLLRMNQTLTVADAVVAESFVYSMLQCGREFGAWLARRGPPGGGAARSPDPPVLIERTDHHLDIRLHRPEVHNALNAAMRDALIDALAVAVADSSVRSVRLSGSGSSFCSGGDLSEFGSSPDPVTAHAVRVARSVGLLVARCAERVTVDVNGACIGAGIEIPAFARRITAAPDASFALPELSMGLIPGAGGTASVVRRIGRHRTAYMALGQRTVRAPLALQWGLVDEIAPRPASGR